MDRLTIRMKKELNEKLTLKAKELELSKNTLVIYLIKKYLDKFKIL